MTVIGVAGCTALIVAGFGLLDSLTAIADLQYVNLTKYEQIYALKSPARQNVELMSKFREA